MIAVATAIIELLLVVRNKTAVIIALAKTKRNVNFSRYKSEHVADHLRKAIEKGDFRDPLPSLRKWSVALDVSPGTLQAALKILKQEGYIGSHPRKGFYLARKPQRSLSHPPLVRMILHDPRHRSSPPPADIIVAISQKLAAHRIGFQIEYCDESRLRAVHKSGGRPAHGRTDMSKVLIAPCAIPGTSPGP